VAKPDRGGAARLMERMGLEDLGRVSRWVLIASLVGLAAGLAAVVFERMIHLVRHYALEGSAPVAGEGVYLMGWRTLLVLGVPAAGAFIAAWIGLRLAPDAAGHGTEQVIETFHAREGRVRKRAVMVKAVTSALTIGSGGSGGQEGPITHIGGGVGSAIADAFRLPHRDRRLFFITGASAGVGALFCAPLGGALFGPEVLYRKPEFEGEAIIPCIIASIVAFTVRTTLTGESRVVAIASDVRDRLVFDDWRHLLPYLALGLACALVSLIYTRTFHAVHDGFDRMRFLTKPQRAGLGGLLLGILALAIMPFTQGQGVFFGGYGLMSGAIASDITLSALVILTFAKILATSLTIGSGGSGGMFAPSMAIGAVLGAAVGHAAQRLLPGLELEPACFAFVGMGGFFAGVAKTPIAAIIIVSEMTGSYGLLAPLMLVSVLHMLLAQKWTLYNTQVPGLVDSPAHAGEFVVDVLDGMRVRDLLDRFSKPTLVSENTTLRKALEIVSASRSTYFPVVDRERRLVGIFGLTDIRRIFQEEGVADLVIVRDFMVEDVVTITAEDTLNVALHRLNDRMIAQLPVVDADDPRKVLGMLSRNNLGAAYHQKLRELRRVGTA
jgi:CIC family chloride channel protein